jgi:xylulokinase
MMMEAVDKVFGRLVEEGVDLSAVKAVKADAMQHCSVYANRGFAPALKALSSSSSLCEQLKPAISRPTSPIWEDRTTGEQAELLTRWFKEPGLAALCANKAELRFPGPQVMKWACESPKEYEETAHVMLLSAFVTSLLAGKVCPVDTGDGWGTNLNSMDIRKPGWNPRILKSVGSWLRDQGLKSDLAAKLGSMTHYDADCGAISPYFVRKYGLSKSVRVLAGTGDNPATLLGCGGGIVVSLGSSYTVNGAMDRIVPSASGEYNVFGYTKNRAMALSVVTNGGKVHETFLRTYLKKSSQEPLAGSDWDAYLALAGGTGPALSAGEPLLLPYLMDESVPVAKAGIVRDGFSADDASANVRGLHVSQAVSLRLHSSHLSGVKEFCVAAGGAKNPFLRQTLADLFCAPCWSIKDADYAAPLGCAISALRRAAGGSYERAAGRVVRKDESTVTQPRTGTPVERLLERYRSLEERSK